MRSVEAGFSPGPGHADLPHADQVVAVSGEQGLAITGPGEGGALGRLSAGGPGHLGPQVLNLVLALEVPDLDGGAAGGAQPVPAGGQDGYYLDSRSPDYVCKARGDIELN